MIRRQGWSYGGLIEGATVAIRFVPDQWERQLRYRAVALGGARSMRRLLMATQYRGSFMVRTMVTIGVYGFDAESFLRQLRAADVGLLLDVRRRRGVRGAEYAWANSLRLQAALEQAGIAYEHHLELAPTAEMLHLQHAEDDRLGVGKRSRRALDADYVRRYTDEILDRADLTSVVSGSGVTALLCVERDPEACHRSLIAQRLAERHHVRIEHLLPY